LAEPAFTLGVTLLPRTAHLRDYRGKFSSPANDCCVDVRYRRDAYSRVMERKAESFGWLYMYLLSAGIIMFLFWHVIVPNPVIDTGGKKEQ
jgi:hypothetical protein